MPDLFRAAPPGQMVDTNKKVGAAALQQVVAAGIAGVARYVPLPGVSAAEDIDAAELSTIQRAGLGLLLVQHVRFSPWDPGQHSGEADAVSAVQAAQAAGYARGAHVFLDLEGIVPGAGAATIAFAEAWAKVVATAGYRAGLYVGFDVPLTPQQLFDLPVIDSYWSDAGPRQVAVRGFAVKQHGPIALGGVSFDSNTIQPDAKNETPVWMITPPAGMA